MDTRRYCVFNETNECFLSLGVTLRDSAIARLNGILARGPLRPDEGSWIVRPKSIHTLALFSSRDLVYLDGAHKVVRADAAFPARRAGALPSEADSVLILPNGTIASSQTQPGNQLVICVADELEFRLRSMSGHASGQAQPHNQPAAVSNGSVAQVGETDRRIAPRKRWPRLVAFDADGASVALHGIRDISTTGLFLMTQERWPLGANIRMSLQRTDGLDDISMMPITMDLRVSRWGADGVGLEFVRADTEHFAFVSMNVR